LSLLKFLRLAYHHSYILATTLKFISFSQQHSWEPHTFFTTGLFWIRYDATSTTFKVYLEMAGSENKTKFMMIGNTVADEGEHSLILGDGLINHI